MKSEKLKVKSLGFIQHQKSGAGFTLIELLIVIAIIALLAAGVMAVINPAAQRRKAKEGVAKSHIAKICQALVACMSSLSTPDVRNCNTEGELGVMTPNQPAGATYTINASGSTGDWNYAQAYVTLTEGACRYRCVVYNNFADWAGQSPGTVVNDAGTCATK